MSGLVGYGSSDEEDDIHPERLAKQDSTLPALLDREALQLVRAKTSGRSEKAVTDQSQAPKATDDTPTPSTTLHPQPEPAEITASATSAPGPSVPSNDTLTSTATTPSSAPLSPYTFERQRLRELSMPSVPNFDIPDSPPPLPTDSEAAADLAATTKKFERFLELKKQGVHFNARLQNTASLRNPSLLPKLMEFTGIRTEESYASTLPEQSGGVPIKWPEDAYVENLVKVNERNEKKKIKERERVDFVPSAEPKEGKEETPNNTSGNGKQQRRSRFDW